MPVTIYGIFPERKSAHEFFKFKNRIQAQFWFLPVIVVFSGTYGHMFIQPELYKTVRGNRRSKKYYAN